MAKNGQYDFYGWASRANTKCSDGRTILKHAFKGNDGKRVPLVWNHNHDLPERVIGHADLQDREEGVYASCSLNDTAEGQRAKELVQHGDITALSIFANQLKQNGNIVEHGVIREVSLVLAGANPGAYIEDVVEHADSKGESAIIYTDEEISLEHSEESEKPKEEQPAQPEQPAQQEQQAEGQAAEKPAEEEQQLAGQSVEHADKEGDDLTVQEVIDSMSDVQREATYLLVGEAYDKGKKDAEKAKEGKEMKHNIFESITNDKGDVLTHSEFSAIMNEAKKGASLKEVFLAHGFENIGNLFPEAQSVNKEPIMVTRDMSWVQRVMHGVHRTPFSKVKSTYAVLTADEARARGFVKGNKKVEQVLAAFKRTTSPHTIYKLQKMDRDDILDITDFDTIAWIKKEMRMLLEEECARAILIGDGRDASDDSHIDPLHIRPIWGDDTVYTVKRILQRAANADDYAFAKAFIRDVVKSRKEYKGSGNPILLTTEDMLTNMLLLEDLNGRVIYDTIDKLKTALRVSDIVTVEVMENQSRTEGNDKYNLLGILVNLNDYNVGADKGGNVNMFDDFDIDYNKYAYLIEGRFSGALVKPYSAITFEEKVSF